MRIVICNVKDTEIPEQQTVKAPAFTEEYVNSPYYIMKEMKVKHEVFPR